MSARLWQVRRLVCLVRGHQPDGVVRGGDPDGLGSVMWCARRCGKTWTPRQLRNDTRIARSQP